MWPGGCPHGAPQIEFWRGSSLCGPHFFPLRHPRIIAVALVQLKAVTGFAHAHLSSATQRQADPPPAVLTGQGRAGRGLGLEGAGGGIQLGVTPKLGPHRCGGNSLSMPLPVPRSRCSRIICQHCDHIRNRAACVPKMYLDANIAPEAMGGLSHNPLKIIGAG